ncbi:MAG: DUF4215 domain-containing protein [Oligoflexia bacterium]|nr:DUF4215 domain-containing protein [Oligoflexia bacterium]
MTNVFYPSNQDFLPWSDVIQDVRSHAALPVERRHVRVYGPNSPLANEIYVGWTKTGPESAALGGSPWYHNPFWPADYPPNVDFLNKLSIELQDLLAQNCYVTSGTPTPIPYPSTEPPLTPTPSATVGPRRPTTPYCGNALLEGYEECDDGNQSDNDGCSAGCLREECGDGVTQSDPNRPEECDDGNKKSGDGCSDGCKREYCGDAIVQPMLLETCDDGNNISGDGCGANCLSEGTPTPLPTPLPTIDPLCNNNGIKEGLEECDGNGTACPPDLFPPVCIAVNGGQAMVGATCDAHCHCVYPALAVTECKGAQASFVDRAD